MEKAQKIHLISIGGAVMHNLAICLHELGHKISGSDDEIFEPSKSRLAEKGLLPSKQGWDAKNITSELDMVILGMHARKDNPELLRAAELNIPVYSFPEFVYEKSKNKDRVVIGGSHGKTTTTAMVMHVLKTLNFDFDYLVGSQLQGFDTMVKLSDAPLIIIEGDEYLNSALDPRPKFHIYKATKALITGIAWDHINVFPTWENYVEQFQIFVDQLAPGTLLTWFAEDKTLEEVVKKRPDLQLLPYNTFPHEIVDGTTVLHFQGKEYPVKVFGKHNLQNLSGAMNICAGLGISGEAFCKAISSFAGTARRLELIAQKGSTTIFRDFAHSPSKVQATVEAVKEQFPDKNVIAVFELHTFSSLTRKFLEEYHQTLQKADHKIVYFNPHVLEMKKLPALDPEEVSEAFGDNVHVYTDSEMLHQYLSALDLHNAVLLLMSSGNFNNMKLDFPNVQK